MTLFFLRFSLFFGYLTITSSYEPQNSALNVVTTIISCSEFIVELDKSISSGKTGVSPPPFASLTDGKTKPPNSRNICHERSETSVTSADSGESIVLRHWNHVDRRQLHNDRRQLKNQKKKFFLKNEWVLMGNRIPENFLDDTTPPPYKNNISNTPIS